MPIHGATIRDVADRAGVSVSTASKAFSDKHQISEPTRQKVLSAAADLHFTPNALIRSLQRGRTNTIGVFTWPVLVDQAYDITMYLLKGIADGIAESRHDLLLYSQFPGRIERVPVTTFLDGRADGVILGPYALSEESLESLEQAGQKAVVLYHLPVPESFGSVTLDNIGGIGEAVGHLLSLGHRRIAFYAPARSYDFRMRREGYRLALEKAGIAFDPALCLTPERYHAEIGPSYEALAALPDPPTALIAGNDMLAFEWLKELTARGIRVPAQFSLIGFDDTPGASAAPGLTTLRQPAHEMGMTAARMIDQLIEGVPGKECRQVMPVNLIVRSTTAAPML